MPNYGEREKRNKMKIVINRCYGGFGLSQKAMEMYYGFRNTKIKPYYYNYDDHKYHIANGDKSGMRMYFIDDGNIPDSFFDTDIKEKNYTHVYCRDIERNDPDLVKTVEILGEEANDRYAELEIVDIPDDVNWEIEEYDGREWVAEVHRTW